MQTAIDWLMDQYVKDNGIFLAGVYEQAKEIEKRQHETTFYRGINIGALNSELDIEGRKESAKHYYKTTFVNTMPMIGNDGFEFDNSSTIPPPPEGVLDAKSIYGERELTVDERMHLWFVDKKPNRDVCDSVDELSDEEKHKYFDECNITRTIQIDIPTIINK